MPRRTLSCRHCGHVFPPDLLAAHLAADHGDLDPVDAHRVTRSFPPPPASHADRDADREAARQHSMIIDAHERTHP